MIIRRSKAMLLCVGLMVMVTGWMAHADEMQEETKEARKQYGREDLMKMISVVKSKTPPVIDGIMKKGEWDDAAELTGLSRVDRIIDQQGVQADIDNMASDQSTFWITYDNKSLYIAHHSPPPERIKGNVVLIPVMLKRTQQSHDTNIEQDDAIHIAIVDPVHPGGDKYVMLVNSIGTTFDCIWGGALGNVPGVTIGWDPQIINQSTLTLKGWVLEAAIPWKGLGPHIEKPQPGEVKYMNFGRIWQEVIKEGHAWAADDTSPAIGNEGPQWSTAKIPAPVGKVLFMGDEGIVVQLDDTGNLARGQAVFAAHIRNLFSTEKRVIAEISTDSGELKDKKEITLKPGENVPYKFTGTIVDFATTKIAFTVTDAAIGKVVHVTTLPVIRPTKPEIYVRRYRGSDMMKFETDIAFIGAADLKKTSITLTVTNKATKEQVFSNIFKGLSSYQPVFELSTKEWATGEYETHFTFNAPGMKPYETVVPYTHPALPHWWNNTYGYEDVERDRVPYPWTEMRVEDGAVQVWGREYRFGKRLLPEQITIIDHPILRAPMRVILKTAGGEVIDTSTVEAKSEWTKTNRTRVESTRVIEGKNVSLKNTLWVEYDGLVWNTLVIEPKKKVDIVSMELEFPLTKEFTDVINTCDYSLRGTGKLKPQGYKGSLTPIWLGNGNGGIQWMSSESNRFFVKDENKAVRVEVSEEGATLRVVMIDVSTGFDSPVAIQFGFIATPVRPKTSRTPEFQERSVTGSIAWYPKGMEFMPAADPGYDYYGSSRERIYVHTNPVNCSEEATKKDATATNDFLFVDEWRANPVDRSDIIQPDLSSKFYRNYFVWRHWNYQQKYGYAGLYYDGPGGNSGSGGSMLGTREIMKRLYNITLSHPYYTAREQAIGVHQSGQPNMAFMGFATYHWDAENYNSIINANQQTYQGVVDSAMYRAQHMGHNFGWPTVFLGQVRIRREWVEANGGAEAVFDQIDGLNLLHDGTRVCAILPGITAELENRRQNDVTELGLHHWVYQFVPYWKQDIVSLADKSMYASFYIAHPSKLAVTNPDVEGYFQMYKHLPVFMQRRIKEDVEKEKRYLKHLKDKAVMIVYNNSDWEGVMRLKPDWKKFGLGSPEELKADNAMHRTGFRVEKTKDKDGKEVEKAVFFDRPEEYARIDGEELVFPMTKWNYRMIVIEKK